VHKWKNILISFSLICFACATKNYIIYLWGDSSVFVYFSPSILGSHNFYITPGFIEYFYEFQKWIIEVIHSLVTLFYDDQYYIFSILLIAPFTEEIIYRLPLFALKNSLNNSIYWSLAVTLSAIFAHSYDLYGIALFPLFILGMCCSWIIKVNKAFWPCLILHFLYNSYSLSFILYQSLFGGD